MDLTEEEVARILNDSVKTELSFATRLRGGLALVFHLGDKVDLQFNGTVTHIGHKFNGPVAVFFGGGLVFAWDDPPPAVLPPKKKLEIENCRDVYDRFTECPFYPRLVKKARGQGYRKCLKDNDCKKKPVTSSKTEIPPQPYTTD